MTSGIYQITIGNNQYIGRSVRIEARWSKHLSELKKGTHKNPILQDAFSKYQQVAFKIIEKCDREIHVDRENYWIKLLGTCNLKTGEDGALPGKNHPMFGKNHKPETIEKIREKSKQRYPGSYFAYLAKIRDRRGVNNPMFGKTGDQHPSFGKAHSPETKEKISVARKGKYSASNNPFYGKKHSSKSKEKMREKSKDNKLYLWINTDGRELCCTRDFMVEKTGMNMPTVKSLIGGYQRQSKGWRVVFPLNP